MKQLIAIACLVLAPAAFAQDLYQESGWAGLANDRKAASVGDALTVLVIQNTEARNSQRNATTRREALEAGFNGTRDLEFGELNFGRDSTRQGEVRRSESFVTQITVNVVEVYGNGELAIEGSQDLFLNGEETRVHVSGRVRSDDISPSNEVLSSRVANAEIRYEDTDRARRGERRGFIGFLTNRFRRDGE